MKIAIVGFDREGRSSYEYFAAAGHDITICDQKTELATPPGVATQLGESYLDNLDQFELIVRTAGLNPQKILAKNPNVTDRITTQVNEFVRLSPTQQIIGVTGTKGKGTTSTLIAKMLEADGKNVHLAGNIGVPALDLLPKVSPEDWVVLELSSFQLSDFEQRIGLAVCLMVVPEHLDWHDNVEDYYNAKAHLFANQTPADTAIYFADNPISKQIASAGAGQKIPFYAPPGATIDNGAINISGQVICKTDELKLLGKHNWQNACAAVTAVWQVTQNVAALKSVLTSFSGLEHRLMFVREHEGVSYYDDSFGTTPETAMVAIQAFKAPKVIVLGGSDKGASYDQLAQVVATGNVRQALLIGDQAARIQQALEKVGFTGFKPGGATMPEIVANARHAAQSGDIVLLSAACASFDMFKNYKDRGEQFIKAVQALV